MCSQGTIKLRFHLTEFTLWPINQSTGTQAPKVSLSCPTPSGRNYSDLPRTFYCKAVHLLRNKSKKNKSHPAHEEPRQQQSSPICNTELIAGMQQQWRLNGSRITDHQPDALQSYSTEWNLIQSWPFCLPSSARLQMANGGGGGQSHKSSVAIASGVGRGGGRAGVVNVSVRVIPGFVRRDILMDPWK